jgi:fido (protein-threonine AMPylation protein)
MINTKAPFYQSILFGDSSEGTELHMLSFIKDTVWEMRHLHPFARGVIRCAYQLSMLLCLFAAVILWIAPQTPDYFRAVEYGNAALAIAPVLMAAGMVAGMVGDLALRRHTPERKPGDKGGRK